MINTSSRLPRRLFLGGSLATAALTAAGCSTERTKPNSGAPGDRAANDGVLTMNFLGPGSTYYRNWNPFTPAENKSVGAAYFYEPLIRINRYAGFVAEPWLAEKWKINDARTEVTFTLRDRVTWSDGEPFDADDVVFTLTAPERYKGSNLVVPDYMIARVAKIDARTVSVTMKKPGLGHLVDLAAINMLPEHIVSRQDLATWTNDSPVGTGPWKVRNFSPQQITIGARDDYWGGPIPFVKECRWTVFANEDAGRALVSQGKLDLATMAWPNAQQTFMDKGKGNTYQVFPTGGGQALLFNCAKGATADKAVRRAISKAIDFAKVLTLYPVGTPLANVTGMAELVWGEKVAPEFRGQVLTADVPGAKEELAAAGWEVQDGKLVKGGKSYTLTLKTVSQYTDWSTWSDGIKEQLKTSLGLDLRVIKLTTDQHTKQVLAGDFDLAMEFGGGGSLLGQFFATGAAGLSGGDVVPLGDPATANAVRYDNPEVTKALTEMASSLDEARITELAYLVQRALVADRPYVTYNQAGNFVQLSGEKWTGMPAAESKPDYIPVPYGGPETTMLLQNLKPVGA
ncbi:ABC transporter substrate-binding protein [Kribbella sp. GL6]|uniref:ABC transporter substrate-binding protein n=1 Tax=Kribbella sp. GL6 TaxID=3419765 RepID=UPI003CFCC97D